MGKPNKSIFLLLVSKQKLIKEKDVNAQKDREMTFFIRFVGFVGLIVTTGLIIVCCSCGDFMKNEDKYFDFKWDHCQYMVKHKFPYTESSFDSNRFESDYRCYCRYFEFMRPHSLGPIFAMLILLLTWLYCLAITFGNKHQTHKKKKSVSYEWSP